MGSPAAAERSGFYHSVDHLNPFVGVDHPRNSVLDVKRAIERHEIGRRMRPVGFQYLKRAFRRVGRGNDGSAHVRYPPNVRRAIDDTLRIVQRDE
jgi:hypothetical protein